MEVYLKRVILISILSMLFTAINVTNFVIINQVARQNGNEWIGQLSTGLIYLGVAFGSLYRGYLSKWTYRTVIFIGSLGRVCFIGFTVLFLYAGFSNIVLIIICIGSIISGLISSMLYNGICNYINQCGRRDNQTKLYFAVYIGIIQSSSLIGSVISASLIEPLGQQAYSLVIFGACLGVALCFLLVRDFQKYVSKVQENIIISSINGNGDLQENTSINVQVKDEAKIPVQLCLPFIFTGVIISYVYSEFQIMFYNAYPNMPKQELNRLTFIALSIEGTGKLLICLVYSYFSAKIKEVTTLFFYNGLIFILSIGVLIYAFSYQILWLICIGICVVGATDCLGLSIAASIAGKWGKSGISLYNFGSSIGITIFTALNIWFDITYLMIFYIATQLLSASVIWRHRKTIDQKQENA